MVKLTKQIIKEYYDAYYAAVYGGHFQQLNNFKVNHKEEAALLGSMHHKRSIIRKDIECLAFCGKHDDKKVYFGALTFNNDHIFDKSKRKQVFTFLNDVFQAFLVVEEYGALHGRYHVHFIGLFKDDRKMDDFFSWYKVKNFGCSKIKPVVSPKKTSQYLCDYLVKQVPRIHRNKTLCSMKKLYENALGFKAHFPGLYETKINRLYSFLDEFHLPF